MSAARIIGLGQPLAGDDGVGIAVIDHLRRQRVELELCEAFAPTALISLLAHDGPVILVDALLDAPAGEVRELEVDAIDALGLVSSHGFSVREAIGLARAVDPSRFTPRLHLIGVTITRPMRVERSLSREVSLAVPRAAAVALRLALVD